MNEAGQRQPQFIITIDTETYAVDGSLPPFQTNIYADLDEGSFGVQRIIDICSTYDAPATFFVDVYMHHHYGKAPVRDLCTLIDGSGHDVQLHAHTSWLPGSTSNRICDFPLNKQTSILEEGRDLIAEWTGKSPVAFRAGAYTANMDTIRALEASGFQVDSSYFAHHPNCLLSRELGQPFTNMPFRIGAILEIPVTCYWLLRSFSFQKLSKIDVNACSTTEMAEVVPQLMGGGVPYVVLFLHSFSFIRWKRNRKGIMPNYRAIDRFEALLESVARRGGRFATMADIAANPWLEGERGTDLVPTLKPISIVPRVLQRVLE